MGLAYFVGHPEHFIPFFLVCLTSTAMLLEILITTAICRQTYHLGDTLTNLMMYVGYVVIGLFWIPVVYEIFVLAHDHSPFLGVTCHSSFFAKIQSFSRLSPNVAAVLCLHFFAPAGIYRI
jgi:hypothetical protein